MKVAGFAHFKDEFESASLWENYQLDVSKA